MRIFNSLTRASRAATLLCERVVLTATVLTVLQEPFIPAASALITRPKHPTPSCFPSFLRSIKTLFNMLIFYKFKIVAYRILDDVSETPIAHRRAAPFVLPLATDCRHFGFLL